MGDSSSTLRAVEAQQPLMIEKQGVVRTIAAWMLSIMPNSQMHWAKGYLSLP